MIIKPQSILLMLLATQLLGPTALALAADPHLQTADELSSDQTLTPDQALVQACLNGDAAALETALARGGRLETRHGERGLTPLMLAIYRDHPKLVQLLLERGANPNASNLQSHTPLIMAAAGGQSDLISLLLQHKAQLEAQDQGGNTALMWAAFWGHLQVARQLLAMGADPNRRNHEHNHALLLAAFGGAGQDSRQLMNGPQHHSKAGRHLPLHFDDRETSELAELLIVKGAEADLRNHQGQTALMLFAAKGKAGPVKLLLAAGASAQRRDSQGLRATDYARRAGFERLARELDSYLPTP